MSRIKMQKITKSFKDKEVLKNISISIEDGEIYGLLGPSGAGKTTIIKILTGQLKPTDGEAYLFDTNTKSLTKEIYGKIGMVLDNSGIYERLSCYDNLAVFADIYGLSKKKIRLVLERVGLGDAIKLQGDKLSKGMKQRLILARAILTEPSLLFLDEPTSGLDPVTMGSIHALILELKEKGTTIFLTTHNMVEAYKLCDRIALLSKGTIVETGKPEKICRKYNTKQQVIFLLKNGQRISFENSSSHADEIAECFRKNNVEAVHSTEPDLETVFMELTGQRLSESEA